jgi:hypothetical protein
LRHRGATPRGHQHLPVIQHSRCTVVCQHLYLVQMLSKTAAGVLRRIIVLTTPASTHHDEAPSTVFLSFCQIVRSFVDTGKEFHGIFPRCLCISPDSDGYSLLLSTVTSSACDQPTLNRICGPGIGSRIFRLVSQGVVSTRGLRKAALLQNPQLGLWTLVKRKPTKTKPSHDMFHQTQTRVPGLGLARPVQKKRVASRSVFRKAGPPSSPWLGL